MIELTEDMFKTGQPFAQGEILLWREEYAPKEILEAVAEGSNDFEPYKLEKDEFMIGHSET